MNRPLPLLNPDMFADCDGYPVPVGVGGKWTAKITTCLADGPRVSPSFRPPPTGRRCCINAVSLDFTPEGEPLPDKFGRGAPRRDLARTIARAKGPAWPR